MGAVLILKSREVLAADRFVERVVWRLPAPLAGSGHGYKYRLALVVQWRCVLRYDNEAGKGDHRHLDGVEMHYLYTGLQQLLADFWHDVDTWRAT